MAPPRHRRPGFSRRVRLGLFLGYVGATAGILVAGVLLLIQRFDPGAFAALRGLALDVTAPVSALSNRAVRGAASIGGSIAAYVDAGSKNRALRAELELARRKLVKARATEIEALRLRRALRVIDGERPPVAVARLVASDASSPRRLATLMAGRGDGVRPGQPVRSADGLIGRVVETGHFAARVLLLSDGGSAVPVRILRGRRPALATGRGDGALELRALIGGGQPFRRGDIAVTSGAGGVFAPNVPVAVIVRADGDRAIGWPLADPARQDVVLVDRPWTAAPALAPVVASP